MPCRVKSGMAAPGRRRHVRPYWNAQKSGGGSASRQPDSNFSLQFAYDRKVSNGVLGLHVGDKPVGDFLTINTSGADQRLYEGGYPQMDARLAYN